MLAEILKSRHIILASSSPRRQELIKGLGLDFEIRIKSVKEEYPNRLRHFEISDYLAQLKSMPFVEELKPNDILITSDTIVWFKDKALGKPKDNNEAFEMLKTLSGHTHEVITSVCFKSKFPMNVLPEIGSIICASDFSLNEGLAIVFVPAILRLTSGEIL